MFQIIPFLEKILIEKELIIIAKTDLINSEVNSVITKISFINYFILKFICFFLYIYHKHINMSYLNYIGKIRNKRNIASYFYVGKSNINHFFRKTFYSKYFQNIQNISNAHPNLNIFATKLTVFLIFVSKSSRMFPTLLAQTKLFSKNFLLNQNIFNAH